MGVVDEIRLGPLRVQLVDSSVPKEGYVVHVFTESSGRHGSGTPTTFDEWGRARKFAGLEGTMNPWLDEQQVETA